MQYARLTRSSLRADAQRNTAQIRVAAVDAVRDRGLAVPLEEVAKAAGVSKASTSNSFGERSGLIEAVIEETVAAELYRIIDHTRAFPTWETGSPTTSLRSVTCCTVDLPSTTSCCKSSPHSEQLMEICRAAGEIHDELIATGALRSQFTRDDLHTLIVDNALALKHGFPPRTHGLRSPHQFRPRWSPRQRRHWLRLIAASTLRHAGCESRGPFQPFSTRSPVNHSGLNSVIRFD